MIGVMRRLLHTALGVWLLVVMTMAQGCAEPAQSASTRDLTSTGRPSAGFPDQYTRATSAQNSTQNNSPAETTGYIVDPTASNALTDYFKHHRLPLVGAQVLRSPANGARKVVLYGFVG